MIKDYMSFRTTIKSDSNLSLEESYMLEVIFDYYNISTGDAFPPYEKLMADLKTKRRAKVSKLLKSLSDKGYIEIKKVGVRNHYKLLKYLFLKDTSPAPTREELKDAKTDNSKPKDSEKQSPVEGQIYLDEVIEGPEVEDVEKLIGLTGMKEKDAVELLKVAANDVEKVAVAFEYAKGKGKTEKAYIKWCIKNYGLITKDMKKSSSSSNNGKVLSFNDFEQRNYSDEYLKQLERKLLGWD